MDDVTDRHETLFNELTDACDNGEGTHNLEFADYVKAVSEDASHEWHDEAKEYLAIGVVLSELVGNDGDHQYDGDWYPSYLIIDDDLNDHLDEIANDCYDIPSDLPSWVKITFDYDALREDYSCIEINGSDYYYR